MLSKDLQHSATLKSYRILKFLNLVGFLIKKDRKFEFSPFVIHDEDLDSVNSESLTLGEGQNTSPPTANA